jgi:uncharacterized protein YggE
VRRAAAVAGVLALMVGLVLWGWPGARATASAPSCIGTTARVSVVGEGQVTATPDLLTAEVDVSTSGPTAHGALSTDEAATTAVTAAFSAGQVASADLQTTDLSLTPTYSPYGGRIVGYQADDTVVAKLRDFTGAGSVLDAASAAGGDAARIGSLTFSLADPRPAESRARADAVHQAAADARAMAGATGETLGPVCTMTDQTAAPASVPPGPFAPAAAVPLSPGTQEVDAQVRLVYALG